MFRPKLFDTLKNHDGRLLRKDIMAGLIVGIVALPPAIAFAIASGVSPEKGLYTAIIAGFIISAMGGSSVQIGKANVTSTFDEAIERSNTILRELGDSSH